MVCPVKFHPCEKQIACNRTVGEAEGGMKLIRRKSKCVRDPAIHLQMKYYRTHTKNIFYSIVKANWPDHMAKFVRILKQDHV